MKYKKILTIILSLIALQGCSISQITSTEQASELNTIIENTTSEAVAEDTEKAASLVKDVLQIIEEGFWDITKEALAEKENISSNPVSQHFTSITQVQLDDVIDGDTLVVESGQNIFKVRLIGIDTPESVNPDESKNNQYGIMASEFTKTLLENYETLYLEYDKEDVDQYGRALCYVWLSKNMDDISNMLQVKILANGYADALTIKPNTKYAELFNEILELAKEKNAGLWQYEGYRKLVE